MLSSESGPHGDVIGYVPPALVPGLACSKVSVLICYPHPRGLLRLEQRWELGSGWRQNPRNSASLGFLRGPDLCLFQDLSACVPGSIQDGYYYGWAKQWRGCREGQGVSHWGGKWEGFPHFHWYMLKAGPEFRA